MRDIQTVRYVTTHYPRLQGLRLVPLGVPFLLSAAWRAGWLAWWPGARGRGATLWFLALLACAVVVSFPIRAWYERQFGAVRARRRDSGVLPLLAFVGLVGLAAWAQLRVTPPLLLPLLTVGVILVLIGLRDREIRPHYIGVGVACGLSACAPALGVPLPARAILFDLLVGLGVMVAGLGDHRALASVLTPPAQPHARPV